MPKVGRTTKMRTDMAHQAVAYARTLGLEDPLVEAIYRAYWEQGKDINDLQSLREIASGILDDLDAMEQAITSNRFADKIIQFDDAAYEQGVRQVPTFFIGGERYAEQKMPVLKKAVEQEMQNGGVSAYAFLEFESSPDDRPYTVINMVATIDGRIVSGERHESVHDLGSKTDHLLMRRIEKQVDAVMLGAHTLRVTPPTWNPQARKRVVVTRSGDVPLSSCFLTGGESFVAMPGFRTLSPNPAPLEGGGGLGTSRQGRRSGPATLSFGQHDVDLRALLKNLREEQHIKRCLVLGGSKLNGQLLQQDLIDEIFLTIAPKIKLGHDLPTIAEADAFARNELQRYTLIEHHVIGDEIFLRYRRTRN